MNLRALHVAALVVFTSASAGCGGSTDETTTPEDSGADTSSDSSEDSTLSMDAGDSSPSDTGSIETMDSAPDADATTDTGGADAADASDATDASDAADAADASDATDAADSGTDASGAADSGTDASDAADATDGAIDASDTAVDAVEAGPSCTGDLSGIGTGNFRIAFRVTTTSAASNGALLNQRSSCSFSVFWDIRTSSGKLVIETDGGSSGADYATFLSTGTVNDGAPHDVVLTRTSGVLLLTIDGVASGTAASSASFGSLPALATGTDVCIGADGTVALPGAVTNVCISH